MMLSNPLPDNNLTVTDQCGRTVTLNLAPERIVSLVPSQTELLHYLGLERQVTGITKFCVHPAAWKESKTLVGGTKNPRIELIRSLSPDLVICNREENRPEDVESIEKFCPVWVSHVNTMEEALWMIRQTGMITGRDAEAERLTVRLTEHLKNLNSARTSPRRIIYLIWKSPWMAAGGGTFIGDIIRRTGWQNCFEDAPRYPHTDIEAIKDLQPELVLLSTEPYPFKEKHVRELEKALSPARVALVDGESFSWYGPRLLTGLPYLQSLAKKL